MWFVLQGSSDELITMGKKIAAIIIILTLLIGGFSSCSKHEGASTPAQNLVGTWRQIQYGYDNNNTGSVDPGELIAQPSSVEQEYTFNSNGTGVLKSGSPDNLISSPFIWKVIVGDSVQLAFEAHDTISYYLFTLTSSLLTLTTSGPAQTGSSIDVLQMYVYVRQ